MSLEQEKANQAIAQLCPACGLCCNGVLFADVRLRKKDNPKQLKALGLPLQRHGQSHRFCQPCPAHQEGLCRIYAERPTYCQAFECQLLLQVKQGQLGTGAALRLIKKARQQADTVHHILSALGQPDPTLSLTERYRALMSEPWDLSDQALVRLRSKLFLAMDKLAQTLDKNFRV